MAEIKLKGAEAPEYYNQMIRTAMQFLASKKVEIRHI
jgi:hypothetical protein